MLWLALRYILPIEPAYSTTPVGVVAILVCRYSSLMLMPLCLDSVGSLDLVFKPIQLWSLNSRFFRSCPMCTACSEKQLAIFRESPPSWSLSLTVQPLCHVTVGLVERRLAVLVLDGDEPAPLDQVGRDGLVVPKAGVVQGRVAVLVDKVDVGLVAEELQERDQAEVTLRNFAFSLYGAEN